MRQHWHLDIEQRRAHGRAECGLVALVIGVGDQRDTRGQQFGARGFDVDVAAAVALVESEAVVGGWLLAVFEFCLRDRGAEVDVPQGRRERLVGLATFEVAQERELARAHRLVRDRAVGLGPVDGQPQHPPEIFEVLFVFDSELFAQFDEVAAADRHLVGCLAALVVTALVGGSEVGVIRQRGIAADAVVVLHAAFGRKPVVVPPHRIEDGLAPHPFETHLHVGVGVAEHVTDVKRPGCRGRGSVDGVDPAASDLGGGAAVEPVGSGIRPGGIPLLLETFEGGLVGYGGHGSPSAICAAPCVRA